MFKVVLCVFLTEACFKGRTSYYLVRPSGVSVMTHIQLCRVLLVLSRLLLLLLLLFPSVPFRCPFGAWLATSLLVSDEPFLGSFLYAFIISEFHSIIRNCFHRVIVSNDDNLLGIHDTTDSFDGRIHVPWVIGGECLIKD